MDSEETEKITRIATFCAGSFWDTESAFRHVKGVVATSVGFMGGTVTAPTYEEVCTGQTGHSEVVMIAYDPGCISYQELLDIFFRSHDPCRRQQGEYSGTQYEPVIFVHTGQDTQLAEEYMRELRQSGRCKDSVMTRVTPASTFYRADECHQQFYEKMAGCYPVLHTGDPGSDE
ncbi:MAG: peptide-methionine (S)-S-oxide reductase MsrA [Methanomicrobiales archaeon]